MYSIRFDENDKDVQSVLMKIFPLIAGPMCIAFNENVFNVACTLAEGHDGCHVAHENFGGKVPNTVAAWTTDHKKMIDRSAMTSREIYSKILGIEQMLHMQTVAHTNDPMNDQEWATHPLAVEYRSLMKQWWDIPAIPGNVMSDIINSDRPLLTRKGKCQTYNQRLANNTRMTPAKKMYVRLMGGKLKNKSS